MTQHNIVEEMISEGAELFPSFYRGVSNRAFCNWLRTFAHRIQEERERDVERIFAWLGSIGVDCTQADIENALTTPLTEE